MPHWKFCVSSLLLLIPLLDAFSVPVKHRQGGRPGLALASSSSESGEAINHVKFEYCTGCRWQNRAFWMSQELLTTFNDDSLSAVTVQPSRPPPGARFVVSLGDGLLWDRTAQEGFPEVKELKQLVRDKIDPALFLGHSDNQDRQEEGSTGEEPEAEEPSFPSSADVLTHILPQLERPNVAIQYCTGCRWMLRAAYFGTELMTTFGEEINSLTLIPSRPPEKGGIFTVTVNGEVVWDRAEQGGFPEVKELKQIVRDKLAPSKDLGHSDTKEKQSKPDDDEEIDDDEAAEMRNYYGVM